MDGWEKERKGKEGGKKGKGKERKGKEEGNSKECTLVKKLAND